MSILSINPQKIINENQNSAVPTPWDDQAATGTSGSFYPPISIDGTRWNKLYPYRLLVVTPNGSTYKILPSGGISTNGQDSNFTSSSLFTAVSKGVLGAAQAVGKAVEPSSGFSLTYVPTNSQWAFQLPISPQQLQITTPYAISNTPTLNGIVEEHSGVRYKMINCSGTMGVLPYKNSVGEQLTSSLGGFFSGTIAAATNVATQFNSLKRAIGGSDGGVDVNSIPGGYAGTGYAQALLLDQFLEQYAEMKKNPANIGCRLAFDIPKQNQTFLVTPVQFTWNQSVDSPGEIKYSFQLKAWKRISLADQVAPLAPLPSVSPSTLQRVIKSVAKARSTVAAVSATIQAVNGDVLKVTSVITNIALLVKDIGGIPQTAADMSVNLVRNLRSQLTLAGSILDTSFKHFFHVTIPSPTGSTVPVGQIQSLTPPSGHSNSLQSVSPNDNLSVAAQAVGLQFASSGGLSPIAIAQGQLGSAAAAQQQNSPANQVFNQPYLYPEFFDSIPVDSLTLTPQQKKNLDEYFSTASLIDITDLLVYKQYLINLASLLANYYGKGNLTYAKIYRTSPPTITSTPMTIEQFNSLNAIYDLIQSINLLTSTQQIDDGRIQSSLGYSAQIATANGIPFSANSVSKILAPVPFGLTIEQIAARYLGDPNRWVEIAALNALQEPYIDESGFIYPLLSNATGRLINVPSNENLYIGQTVVITAQNLPSTTRKIISIEQINQTNYLLTLDGKDNLNIYTTAGQAKMKAYLSGTVNSQSQIYIPSTDAAPNDLRTRPVPAFTGDNLVGLSKIDWLLNDYGDIALDAYGDFRLAGGLPNLIQALKLKFAKGWATNLMHPTYGAGVSVGQSTADFDIKGLYAQIANAVLSDPRFGSIVKLTINVNGNSININLAVTIANGSGILPINFDINV